MPYKAGVVAWGPKLWQGQYVAVESTEQNVFVCHSKEIQMLTVTMTITTNNYDYNEAKTKPNEECVRSRPHIRSHGHTMRAPVPDLAISAGDLTRSYPKTHYPQRGSGNMRPTRAFPDQFLLLDCCFSSPRTITPE